jgi:hypothetical protein
MILVFMLQWVDKQKCSWRTPNRSIDLYQNRLQYIQLVSHCYLSKQIKLQNEAFFVGKSLEMIDTE